MSRRLLAVGSAIGLLLPLAACGGDDPDTKPSTSTSASASPSPSASPTPTTGSQSPQADTREAAIAFVRQFVDVVNEAQRTGDLARLKAMSDPSCDGCTDVATVIEDFYSDGGSLEGGERTIDSIRADPSQGGWLILAGVSAEDQTLHRPGQEDQVLPGGEQSEEYLVRRHGKWKVERWTQLD